MPPINLYELGFDKVYIKIINSSNYISIRLVFVQLSDTVMVGQIGSRDLAAISFGGNVYFFIYIFGIGIVSVGVIHDGVSTTIHREVLQSATLWVVGVERLSTITVLQVCALLELVIAYLAHIVVAV